LLDPAERGFGMVDLMACISVMVVGLLGFVTTVTNTYVLSRSSREVDAANTLIVNVVENFRAACAQDFTAALTLYSGGVTLPVPTDVGSAPAISATLILDEPSISPPIDLNGDGDTVDMAVAPADARAGFLRVDIAWNGVLGPMSLEYTSVVARGHVQ
jgi:Tfp pilus assembly protein PilV